MLDESISGNTNNRLPIAKWRRNTGSSCSVVLTGSASNTSTGTSAARPAAFMRVAGYSRRQCRYRGGMCWKVIAGEAASALLAYRAARKPLTIFSAKCRSRQMESLRIPRSRLPSASIPRVVSAVARLTSSRSQSFPNRADVYQGNVNALPVESIRRAGDLRFCTGSNR